MTTRRITPNTLPNAFPQFNRPWFVQPQKIEPITTNFKAKKAGTNGTHCFLILDESGSMGPVKNDTIGGVNIFIDKQKEDKDNTKLTIIKFEGGNIRTPIDGVDVSEISKFKDYDPCGGTNLLDAVGHTLEKINTILDSMKKKDRPSIFIQIVTDGQENQSRKYLKEHIQGMIKSATKSDWVVTYVGANVDSFNEATSLGIHASAASNYKTSNMSQTFSAMASSTSRMKSLRSEGATAMSLYDTNAVYNSTEKDMMEE